MAILFMEGFDHYDGTTTSFSNGGYLSNGNRNLPIKNILPVGGVGPTAVQTSTAYTIDSYLYPLGGITNRSTIGGGVFATPTYFTFKRESTSTIFVQLYCLVTPYSTQKAIGISNQCYLRFATTTNTYSLVASPIGGENIISSGILLPDTWRYYSWNFLEYRFVLSSLGGATNGSLLWRVNGREIVNITNVRTRYTDDFNAYAAFYYDPFYSSQVQESFQIDDVVVYDTAGSSNNDWIGEAKIVTVFPKEDGYYKDFKPSRNLEVVTVDVIEATYNGTTDLTLLNPTIDNSYGQGVYTIPIPWATEFMGKTYESEKVFFHTGGGFQFGSYSFRYGYSSFNQAAWSANNEPIVGNWSPNIPQIGICGNEFSNGLDSVGVYGELCQDCEEGERTYRMWIACLQKVPVPGNPELFENRVEFEIIFFESEPNRIDILTKSRYVKGVNGIFNENTFLEPLSLTPGLGESIRTYGPEEQNYRMVNDIIMTRNVDNFDYAKVSHVYSNTVNHIDSYKFGEIASYPGINVRAVQVTFDARKSDTGASRQLAPVAVDEGNTSIYVGDSIYLGTTDQFYTTIYETNPLVEGENWTAESVNETQFGFKVTE